MHQSHPSHLTPAARDLEAIFAKHGTSTQELEDRAFKLTIECIENSDRPVPEDEIIAFINEREPDLLSILQAIDCANASADQEFSASTAHSNSLLTAKELARRDVIRALNFGHVSRTEAAAQLGINVRQLCRLRRHYHQHGDSGLIDRRRFTKGNSRKSDSLKAQVLGIITHDYQGLGPTAVQRKLVDECGLTLHLETVRLWMRRAGMSTARRSSYAIRRVTQPTITAASGKVAQRFRARHLPRRLRGDAPVNARQTEVRQNEMRPRTFQSENECYLMPAHFGIYGALQQICYQDDIDIQSLVARYMKGAIESPKGYFNPPPSRLLATVGGAAWQAIELPQQLYQTFADAMHRVDPRITVADAFNHVLWIIVRSFLGPNAVQIEDLLNLKQPFIVMLPSPRARERRKQLKDLTPSPTARRR